MGNLSSSLPSQKYNLSKEEKEYFNTINKTLKTNEINLEYNIENIKVCLEEKSFVYNTKPGTLIDCTWSDYFYDYLFKLCNSKTAGTWARELMTHFLKEEFLNENKYTSLFFYRDFYFKTLPESIIEEDFKNTDNTGIFSLDYKESERNTIQFQYNDTNTFELDVTDNLGGSFLEVNTENFASDDPNLKYHKARTTAKRYISIFKEHIFNNREHPINRIIFLFVRIFCKNVNKRLNILLKQIENLEKEEKNNRLKILENEVTLELQTFIIKIQNTVKLFYQHSIDYNCFAQEKDELMNLMTCLVFRTDEMSKTIFNLYKTTSFDRFHNLEKKLANLQNVTPEKLGIPIKFCLNKLTLDLQRKMLEEKQKERDKKEKEDEKIKDKNIINSNNNNITNNNNNNKGPLRNNSVIEEKDEEDEFNSLKHEQIKEMHENSNIENDKENIKDIISTASKIEPTKQEKPYVLDQIEDDNFETRPSNVNLMDNIYARNTVTAFNNKTFNFPKLHTILRNTIKENDDKIQQISKKDIKLPYSSGIKILKSVPKYKTPFEKMLIIASISDEITECATDFWKDMENFYKHDFLSIEADHLMTIFLYILIKSQLADLSVYAKMIQNFTTQITRGTMIGYYYTTLEAAIKYIEELKDEKDLIKLDKQLKNSRYSLAEYTTMRLSVIV